MTTDAPVTDDAFRSHTAQLLAEAGFESRELRLVEDRQPVVVAENSYYLVAFQVFELWSQLMESAASIETALWGMLEATPQTNKTWDAYLVLVCRAELTDSTEFNQLVGLVYDTKRTRKIVGVDVGDELTGIDDLIKPFTALSQAQVSAKGRDPLTLLAQKLEQSGEDATLVRRIVTTFRETGHIIDE